MSLDEDLLGAHARGDQRGLIALYRIAADQAELMEAKAFYLTHAFVFALELGDDAAEELRLSLVKMGCEPQGPEA